MNAETDKIKHSKRLHKDEAAIKKQVKIAKHHNHFDNKHPVLEEPHRLAKHHAMDCGNPNCGLCGNPRHIRKGGDGGGGQTIQERRMFQDLDEITDKHSNGLAHDEKDLL